MKFRKIAGTGSALALVSSLALSLGATTAMAAPIDLSSWVAEGGGATWTLGAGNTSVKTNDNKGPTVFHNNDFNSWGNRFTSTIEVTTEADEDYIGFVLGYQDGDMTSGTPNSDIDYLVIDWKQATESASGNRTGQIGLALSRVTGNVFGVGVNGGNARDAYDHTGAFTELARGLNLGSTGWADNTSYDFEVLFGTGGVQVFVDNVLEIDYAGPVSDGAFGFYNFSQIDADYSLDAVTPVPVPAALPLLLAGLGGLGFVARRKRKAA